MKTRYPKYFNRNGIPHEILLNETMQKLKEFESRRVLVQALLQAKRADLDAPSNERLGKSNPARSQEQPKRRVKSA